MFNFRIMLELIRHSGLGGMTCIFVVVFLVCSAAVWLGDRTANTFWDGMWFSFQAVSTIGFGDVPAQTPLARICTVVLSVFSIFYIALITGVVVSYCTEALKVQRKESLATFRENLGRLDEMTPEELSEFSARVKDYLAKH